MKTSELQELLQDKMGFVPKAELMAQVLGLGSRQSYYQRVSRDSEFSIDELKKIEEHFAIKLIDNINSDCLNLPYYEDVYASCGKGTIVFSESTSKIPVPKNLINEYSINNEYSVINSRGDSMTPLIQDDDKLIVKHWDGSQIIDNRVYVFTYNDEIFVKRLVKNITKIIIKSDNTMYEPIKINGEDKKFKLIGQIVGLLRERI